MEDLEERVMNFFRIHDGLHIKVKDKNSIINPPNLFNDDAEIVLEEFFREFEIKGDEYLDLDKYFYNFLDYFLSYWRNLLSLKRKKREAKTPITIAHMIEVAKRKEWFEPE